MKSNNNTFMMIPQEIIDDLREAVRQLRKAGQQIPVEGEHISEDDAKARLGRETTWFWYMRKKGRLPYFKVGAKVFYKESDIESIANKIRNGQKP
ncbi:helix-turn-helix domain-containing protein [Fulvivirga ulvae]|uniref:helix-turn-helix transcriptional regulator n=1 Tax=Fulvivirga ulvae TaxID=2904245 RepID=UPI001F36C118|nr:helix-turn-helix domain-containing protein [Fulvivirga ulvae]UII32826.1 helix-turn-helix domain-containing protein [Fulvivirga ulvae]